MDYLYSDIDNVHFFRSIKICFYLQIGSRSHERERQHEGRHPYRKGSLWSAWSQKMAV